MTNIVINHYYNDVKKRIKMVKSIMKNYKLQRYERLNEKSEEENNSSNQNEKKPSKFKTFIKAVGWTIVINEIVKSFRKK
jgi:hypothetical protein